ncbi:MAG: hypothetical protein M3N37_09660 [Actinomycetota bacterium]|nr:hypothetical protein [Actinomycetota bacterium]
MRVAVIDVDAVVHVVAQCPSVARLTSGTGVEAVSYLPGRRVPGVRVGEGGLEVHVVARYGPTMAQVAEEIRRGLRPLVGDAAVSVVIHDLDVDADADADREGHRAAAS